MSKRNPVGGVGGGSSGGWLFGGVNADNTIITGGAGGLGGDAGLFGNGGFGGRGGDSTANISDVGGLGW